jgi:hypothetical protein
MHLPHGLSYGRLRKENAARVLEAGLDGRIAMDHFRGRTIFDEPVQAAEILLRNQLNVDRINALHVKGIESLAEKCWRVEVDADADTYICVVETIDTGKRGHQSCADEKASPIVEYKLTTQPTV